MLIYSLLSIWLFMTHRGPHPNQKITMRIVDVLKKSPLGLNIKEISQQADTTLITAKKHLERLVAEGKIQEIYRTNMRIFYINRK